MSWGRTRIFFENEADASAGYHAFIGGYQEGLVVAFSLGEGLGFSILKDGEFISGPKEAHKRIDYSSDAPVCACGIHGCSEIMANSSFVLSYVARLAEEYNINLPDGFYGALEVSDIILMFKSKDKVLRSIANDVFMRVGKNLTPLCAEVSRILREPEFKVILTGELAGAWQIIKNGLEEEIGLNYPG
jgi:predicted NBD/HSP70 family sugar kinase